MSEKKPVGGMILYPMEYCLDKDNADCSYVVCRDINDESVIFTLNPEDRHRQAASVSTAKSIPQLKKFAETHRQAKNPCFASLENNKRNPCGIFVGEQIVEKGRKEVKFKEEMVSLPSFEGKWASIVRDSDQGHKAPVGFGYLEVNYGSTLSPNGNEIKLRYEEVCRKLGNPESDPNIDLVELSRSKATLAGDLRADRKKWFVGVLIHVKNTITLEINTHQALKDALSRFFEHYTKQGVYGGVLVRLRDGNTVITSYCKSGESSFDFAEKKVKAFDVVVNDFMKYGGNRIVEEAKKRNFKIDVIPTERFNCGSMGNDMYNKDMMNSVSKVMKTYVDNTHHNDPLTNIKKVNGFLFAKICMRLAMTVDGQDNYLLSSIHAFSAPIANIMTIDRTGKPSYQLDNDHARHDQANMRDEI